VDERERGGGSGSLNNEAQRKEREGAGRGIQPIKIATFAAALPRLAACPARSSAKKRTNQVEFLMERSGGRGSSGRKG
jgi:hypothetical protein